MADPILRRITKDKDLPAAMEVDFVKDTLEIDLTDNRLDPQIVNWIGAAKTQAERLRGEVLVTQTWEMILPSFPTDRFIRLRPRPVQSIESVTYRINGALTTFGSLDDNSPAGIKEYEFIDNEITPLLLLRDGESWPSGGATDVRIRIVCGYVELPELVKSGMLMLVGHWHENREAVVEANSQVLEVPMGVRAMLARPKV